MSKEKIDKDTGQVQISFFAGVCLFFSIPVYIIIFICIFCQDVRILLEEMPLLKKFNMDARKFSRNIELSSFSTTLNAGAGVESNFIWLVY